MDAGPCNSKNDEIFSAMGGGGARPTATGRTSGVEGSPTRSTIAVSDVSCLATKMHPGQFSKTYVNTSPTASPAASEEKENTAAIPEAVEGYENPSLSPAAGEGEDNPGASPATGEGK